MTEIIYAIQVVLAIMFALWTYDRFAKRWSATLGEEVVKGSVHRADFVPVGRRISHFYPLAGVRRRWQASLSPIHCVHAILTTFFHTDCP